MRKFSIIKTSTGSLSTSTPQVFALATLSLALAISAAQAGDAQRDPVLQQAAPKPLAAWSFAQADGDFVPDASGHGFDALIYGKPRLEPRWRGQVALKFDGNGNNSFWQGGAQKNGLGVSKRLNRAFTHLSIEAWVRKQPAWWMPIVYRDLWDTPSGFGLYMEWTSGKAYFGHYDSIGHGSAVQSESVVQDGQWHYVVGTMEPDSCCGKYLYRIYVDGKLDAEQIGSWGVEEASDTGGILKIAYPNRTGADKPFQGALDGIAIFDTTLTPAQIKARFESSRERL